MPTSAVNILIDSMLPEDLRDSNRLYDKKGVGELLSEVAKRYPDRYSKLSKAIGDIGQQQVWDRGETFRLADFKPVIDRQPFYDELDKREAEIKKKVQDPAARKDALGTLYGEMSDRISKATNAAALSKRNNIAITVLTGARGKDAQLRDLLSTPGFYTDGKMHTIPGFIRQSYAEGLRPADYLAGTYGARNSVTHSKRMTAKGGFYGKTLGRASATTYVTEKDCGTSNGIALPMDEKDIRGRVLQRETAGLPAGTVIDRKAMEKLKDSGEEQVLVRSPMTCQAEHGICAKCYGVKSNGKMPKVGDHVGYTSAQAASEPIIQGALSMKHVTSASGPKTEFSGLDYLNQVAESPEEFKDRAVVAKTDGRVDNIREAPQGGQYVTINGEDHYVAPDRFINVKKGQTLEAGDPLTDGLQDPEDVMKYKGLGAARSYWAETMAKISKASGAGADRRVFETLARSAVDHVDLDDPIEEGFLPDDRVRYSQFVLRRTPPRNVVELPAGKAVGQYLEAPALHHTVGTRVTASMAEDLAKKGFPKLQVSPTEPGFRPTMVRLTQVASTDDDWLASLGGSYLGNQLREGITRAQDTNIEKSWHPVPRLAVGEGYADKLEETGQF
jgi:DNA-directed RNA polymerase subunit beta'